MNGKSSFCFFFDTDGVNIINPNKVQSKFAPKNYQNIKICINARNGRLRRPTLVNGHVKGAIYKGAKSRSISIVYKTFLLRR